MYILFARGMNVNWHQFYTIRNSLFSSQLFVTFVTGVRQVQDIYVRLIDSATKQVSNVFFISLYFIGNSLQHLKIKIYTSNGLLIKIFWESLT